MSSTLLLLMTGPAGLIDVVPPTAPTNPTVLATSTTELTFDWDAATDNVGVTLYHVERKIGPGSFSEIGTTPAATTAYNDTGRTPGTLHTYRVRASDGHGNYGAYSSNASDYTFPSAPSGLAVTINTSTSQEVTWTNVGVGYDHLVLERNDGSGFVVVDGAIAFDAMTFNNTGLTPDTEYSYRIKAVGTTGHSSAYSNTATETTEAGGSFDILTGAWFHWDASTDTYMQASVTVDSVGLPTVETYLCHAAGHSLSNGQTIYAYQGGGRWIICTVANSLPMAGTFTVNVDGTENPPLAGNWYHSPATLDGQNVVWGFTNDDDSQMEIENGPATLSVDGGGHRAIIFSNSSRWIVPNGTINIGFNGAVFLVCEGPFNHYVVPGAHTSFDALVFISDTGSVAMRPNNPDPDTSYEPIDNNIGLFLWNITDGIWSFRKSGQAEETLDNLGFPTINLDRYGGGPTLTSDETTKVYAGAWYTTSRDSAWQSPAGPYFLGTTGHDWTS